MRKQRLQQVNLPKVTQLAELGFESKFTDMVSTSLTRISPCSVQKGCSAHHQLPSFTYLLICGGSILEYVSSE